jgi:hypothetical protein
VHDIEDERDGASSEAACALARANGSSETSIRSACWALIVRDPSSGSEPLDAAGSAFAVKTTRFRSKIPASCRHSRLYVASIYTLPFYRSTRFPFRTRLCNTHPKAESKASPTLTEPSMATSRST